MHTHHTITLNFTNAPNTSYYRTTLFTKYMLGIIPCKYTHLKLTNPPSTSKLTQAPHSYSKSIIHDEKQYQIAENIFGAGYKGGENTRFYQEKAELLDDVHAEAFRASIICMMVPYRTNQGGRAPRIQNPIDSK